jgi:predicted metal-dependent hydrolase
MGLRPAGVKITSAAKRFGSCSAKNSLCFSWRLMRYPEAAIDYVIVHELAHIRHKNHGRDFYTLIGAVLPDYRERKKLLKYKG